MFLCLTLIFSVINCIYSKKLDILQKKYFNKYYTKQNNIIFLNYQMTISCLLLLLAVPAILANPSEENQDALKLRLLMITLESQCQGQCYETFFCELSYSVCKKYFKKAYLENDLLALSCHTRLGCSFFSFGKHSSLLIKTP